MHVRVYSFSRSTLSSNNVAMAKQISIWCWLGFVLPGENETFIFELRTLNNTERWAPYPNWSLTTFSWLREEENSINAKILFSFQSTMEIFFTMKKYKIKYAKVRVWGGFKRKQKTRVKVCLPHRQPHQSARNRLKGSLVNTYFYIVACLFANSALFSTFRCSWHSIELSRRHGCVWKFAKISSKSKTKGRKR